MLKKSKFKINNFKHCGASIPGNIFFPYVLKKKSFSTLCGLIGCSYTLSDSINRPLSKFCPQFLCVGFLYIKIWQFKRRPQTWKFPNYHAMVPHTTVSCCLVLPNKHSWAGGEFCFFQSLMMKVSSDLIQLKIMFICLLECFLYHSMYHMWRITITIQVWIKMSNLLNFILYESETFLLVYVQCSCTIFIPVFFGT